MPDAKIIPENWRWLLEVSIGIAIVVIVSLFLRKIVSAIKKRTKPDHGIWRKKIHKILHMPLQVAVWGFGIAYAFDVIGTHFGLEELAKYARPLKVAFIVACFGWIALRWVNEVFKHLAQKSEKLGLAPSTIYALSKLSSFVIIILVFLVIFPIFGINILPLLAFGGIGVAGLAFAAQDFIANFFGGITLHFTGMFAIGDEIEIPSKEKFEGGIVKEIGWYVTVVEDFYRRPVFFPNSLFSKTHVINCARRTHRRVKETITIGYDSLPDVEKIVEELDSVVASHPEVDEKQSFSITLNKFGQYGLDIYLYFLIHRMGYIKFLQVKQEILVSIETVIRKYNAEFVYPTTNVNLFQHPPK